MLILKWGYFWPWGNEFISCCSVSQLCLILCDLMCCSMPSFPDLHFLPEFAQTNLHWVNDAIQTSHPLPPSPPALSLLRAFSNKLAFASGGFSTRSSNEYSGLISFRIDWFYLLTVQGAVKSLLQHHSSEHQCFGSQLSLCSHSHTRTWLLEKT